MRLTLENETYGVTVTVDRPDLDDECVNTIVYGLVRPALLGVGFFEGSVDRVLSGVDSDAAVLSMIEGL